MKLGLFATCLVDGMFPNVGLATATVLRRLGHQVDFPQAQSCCGQMHINTGYPGAAVPLVRNLVNVFADYDAVVVPSGSCTGSIRHQHEALAERAGDSGLRDAVRETALRTYELTEFLVDVLGVTDVGATYPHRVTYHPTCHSLRMLKVGDRPLHLLRAVRGIDLVELPEAETCCGFGGTFAVKNPEVSTAMLLDKTRNIDRSGAEVCSASDASCLMHIGGGLSREGSRVKPVHLAEILASTEEQP